MQGRGMYGLLQFLAQSGRSAMALLVFEKKEKKEKAAGLKIENWFAKVVLDSRDSVVLETWFEKDIRKDIRTWFGTWFAKVVLDSRDSVVLETWFEKDIRTDIRTWFETWFKKKLVLGSWFEMHLV
jgi:hypothetical protein